MSNPGLKNPATLISRSANMTFQLGEVFGGAVRGGEVIALIGTLGAGKTQFVKGLAKGIGIPPENVTSPTFALMQSYEGRITLTHIDLYRLENPNEIAALGLEDEVEASGFAAIEWADKAEGLLPPGRLTLTLTPQKGDMREISIQVTDAVHAAWRDRVLKAHPELLARSAEKAHQ